MNDTDQQYFRDALTQQRNSILERASHRFESGSEVNADGVPDFADYAADKALVEVSDQIAGSEDNLLEKINLALERLDKGTYHKCALCSSEIPIERLKAKPAVTLCVKCQSEKESATS